LSLYGLDVTPQLSSPSRPLTVVSWKAGRVQRRPTVLPCDPVRRHKSTPRAPHRPHTLRNPAHEGRAKLERLLRGRAGARLRRFCSVRSASARKLPQMPGRVKRGCAPSAMERTAALRKRRRSALYRAPAAARGPRTMSARRRKRPGGTKGSFASCSATSACNKHRRGRRKAAGICNR
jgi:hypothetical protein